MAGPDLPRDLQNYAYGLTPIAVFTGASNARCMWPLVAVAGVLSLALSSLPRWLHPRSAAF